MKSAKLKSEVLGMTIFLEKKVLIIFICHPRKKVIKQNGKSLKAGSGI